MFSRERFISLTLITMGLSVLFTGCSSSAAPEEIIIGSFEGVSQNSSVIELGEEVDLNTMVTFNPENIKSVSMASAGGFDSNKIGNYTVVYTVTNTKDNTQDQEFSFEVKDTTAPTLNLTTSGLYFKKGDTFDINDYARSTDKSGTQEIKYDGEIDPDKEGKYKISVSAMDASGNTSEVKELTVVVEDRSNLNIRNSKWGDSQETVLRYETAEKQFNDTGFLQFLGEVAGKENTQIAYWFNENDELYEVGYFFFEDYINYDFYVSDFESLYDKMVEKYGEGKNKDQTGGLYKYTTSEGHALQLGYKFWERTWDLDDMTIDMGLYCDNEIHFFIYYNSKEIEPAKTDNGDL